MIRFLRGNLFESQAIALVNTVNCAGVMGKGIAYQFRRAFPAYHDDYVRRCRRHDVRLGEVYAFEDGNKIIVTFPTKNHWKSKSRLEDIDAGLKSLGSLIAMTKIGSIAVPPLGCGNGGLAWQDVRPLITRHLGALEGVEAEVYEPAGVFESKVAQEPRVSLAHFVLVALRVGLKNANKLNLQKSAYFFNVFLGEEYFRFEAYRYGPYCPAIEPMSNAIRDYVAFTGIPVPGIVEDGLRRRLSGNEAERLRRWLPLVARVHTFCNRYSGDLEALATAHAVVAKHGPVAGDAAAGHFLSWSDEKAMRFAAPDVEWSLSTLESEGLIRRGLLGYEVPCDELPGRN